MIRILGLMAALLCALPALARDSLPAVFGVMGVPVGDVLNIRAAPSASAPILGTLARDAQGVEVLALSENGAWGMVWVGEGNGWVSMRYLREAPAGAGLPRPLACLGTEPFWHVLLGVRGDEWNAPDTGRIGLMPVAELTAAEGYHIRSAREGGDTLHLTVTRETCSDGMSDRRYGFSARLFLQSAGGNRLLAGCCTLDAGQRRGFAEN